MDGMFMPPDKGYRIITRQYSVTFSIGTGASGVIQLDFGSVIYNGVLPFSIRSIWLGAGQFCLGNYTVENNHFYVTVVNPVGSGGADLIASVVLNYYVRN